MVAETQEATLSKIFATPLIEARPAAAQPLVEPLRQAILARRASHPGIARSNILGWHSDTMMLDWGGEAAGLLARATVETCAAFTHDMGRQPNGEPRFEFGMDMWANISPAGASNQMHAHPSSLWSAVFYVDDGGDSQGGELVLLDPRFPMNRMMASDVALGERPADGAPLSQIHIQPEAGKMVIFPSWLMHAVRPHSGPGERISIAMNLPVRQVA